MDTETHAGRTPGECEDGHLQAEERDPGQTLPLGPQKQPVLLVS